ncbi:MAG: tol-pal system protein YbgF [Gammaproteobacteria bacterium]
MSYRTVLSFNRPFISAVALSATLALGGCVTTPEVDPVLVKLTELEDRLVGIERVVNNQSLVGLQGQLDQLREDMRSVRGVAEQVQFQSEAANKRQRTQYVDLDGRIAKLEKGGSAFPSVVGANSGLAGSDRASYEAAFELLKSGRYDDAKAAFAEFTTNYPSSTFADNANFWLAEAHYVTGDYKSALAQFQTVITNFPSSAKVADAWMKVGYCQYELKAYAEARAALEAVVSSYPDTTPARLAQQRLQQMEGEGR